MDQDADRTSGVGSPASLGEGVTSGEGDGDEQAAPAAIVRPIKATRWTVRASITRYGVDEGQNLHCLQEHAYNHVIPELERDAANRIDVLLGGSG